ncbi:radical SAM protein [bacterium]|nr:radical SAM protein [bacterium]
MTLIYKTRREWFGGVVYSENPGFTAFVDERRADSLAIPQREDLTHGLFSAPLDVHMSITTRCNLHCRGCYTQNNHEQAKDLPLDLAQSIIDRLADMNILTIALGGGEPFLHPHLFFLAEYIRNNNIVPNITTNGLVMDAAIAKACQVFGSIHLSYHQHSDLDHLTEAVHFLNKAKIAVGLNVLVSASTFSELPHLWTWCSKQGISRLLLLKFKLTANNQTCQDLVLTPKQEQSLLPLIRTLSRRHDLMPMLDCSLFPALAFHAPNKKDLDFFDVNGCVGGHEILAITIDGLYKPCSFYPKACGNALNLNRHTWKMDQALADFRNMKSHSACTRCEYVDLCHGGCRISSTQWCYSSTKNLMK